MRYAYEALLRLYPGSYRADFGPEMTSVFEQATGDHRPRGFLAYARFLSTEFLGLVTGAIAMWTDEYMERSRRRVSAQFLISLLAGAAITLFFQNFFYVHIAQTRSVATEAWEAPPTMSELMLPLIIAGGVLVFISVFSVAFVWNMRIIGNRTGRLKPIWMPGGTNARTTRRDQTLHRDSGGQRRELHGRGRRGHRLSGTERFRQIYNLEDDHGSH